MTVEELAVEGEPAPPPQDDADRMALLLFDASRRIWPFVRYWGLCGADPEAVRAMLDLGRALGEIKEGDGPGAVSGQAFDDAAGEAASEERLAVAVEAANWVREALPAQIGRRGAETAAQQLREAILRPLSETA